MFRTLLVHVDGSKESDARTRLAIDLARQFDATLIGLTAGLPPLPMQVYADAFGAVAIGPDYTDADRKLVKAEFEKCAEAFTKATADSGLETVWREAFEAPTAAIIRAAAAADILVVGVGDRSLLGDLTKASAGDIVLRTGRPVLVVTNGQEQINVQKVLVAWKDTPEAQRAVADALPFMKRAQEVVVAQVSERGNRPANLDDATAFLLRHGIAAKKQVIPANDAPVEDRILDAAKKGAADLIVAGAYGHSRLREWVFGGVTRGLLTRSPVPCLFSH